MDSFWKRAEKNIVMHGSMMNAVESCIGRHAAGQPGKLAFIFEDENGRIKKYTYKQLQQEVNRFANLLNRLDVRKSSRIFLFLPKIHEMFIAFLGTIKHGSIAAPLFEAFQAQGLELRLKRGEANALVTNKELLKRLKHKPRGMKTIVIDSEKFKKEIKKMPDKFDAVMKNKKDTALMIFTSSTAGTPVAGIELPHYGIVQQDYAARLVLDLHENDRYWCTAHPGWVLGAVYGILAPLSIGCTSYVYEGHFDAKKWLSFLARNRISVVYTAPTALRMLKAEAKKPHMKSLRVLCSAGEALTQDIYSFYKKLGIDIYDSYWQTETGAIVIATWKGLKKKKGSMGKAIPGINAAIKDEAIALKPGWPAMMTGIYRHKEMYKSYFKHGWFKTNDSARIDKDKYFFFIGRKDDIIKTSGERVSPIEIESFLMSHKAVKEAAVVGVPDKTRGSILKAFVVLKKNQGFSNPAKSEKLKEELSLFVKKNYAGHAYPRQIEFIKELPKTNSGKIIRMKLRERKG